MRLLHALPFLFFIVVSNVSAQATPGQHEAEASPDFAYTGTGWTQVVDGDYVVMESNEAGDSVDFVFDGGSIMVMRTLFVADSAVAAEACIDGVCKAFNNSSSNEMPRIPVVLEVPVPADDPHTLTITNIDGGRLQIDSVMVFSVPTEPELIELELDPSKEYFVLGDRMVAVDFLITGGEIAIVVFLAFISMGLIGIALLVRWHHG